jgi:hypothetical protein
MKFKELVAALRTLLKQCIKDGSHTGLGIANELDITQTHISNFLNEQRGISFDLADDLLQFLGLDIEDLVAGNIVKERVPIQNQDDSGALAVPIVNAKDALRASIEPRRARGTLYVPASAVTLNHSSRRKHWLRLIALERTPREFLIVDRHSYSPGQGGPSLHRAMESPSRVD